MDEIRPLSGGHTAGSKPHLRRGCGWLGLAPSRHGMNRASSEQPLFAVIGCGLIGRKRVLALGKTPPLAYTCDLDAARAADLAKLAPGCVAVTDYQQVLADARVTAVIVATLNASLAP